MVMVHPRASWCVLVAFVLSWAAIGLVSAKLECEELPTELCAFAVSSTGARCVLEKNVVGSNHDVQYGCQTSIVSTEDEFKEWVETDDCVNLCGLERMSVGLSSDAVVEEAAMASLCSASCQDNCPNVIDLYSKLAAGEGVSMRGLCHFMHASLISSRKALRESSKSLIENAAAHSPLRAQSARTTSDFDQGGAPESAHAYSYSFLSKYWHRALADAPESEQAYNSFLSKYLADAPESAHFFEGAPFADTSDKLATR